ncbi:MAG: hypothetical protein IKQ94_06975 [Bacteroidales bacterium]|nr:hypothetical protein [Bacteroidales bacterium]
MPLLPHISVAIPLMDELENLPALVECLQKQTFHNFDVYVCVNQPENWWGEEAKQHICINNAVSILFLQSVENLSITIIDRSSRGHGWPAKRHGVGYARKELFDTILQIAADNEIIVSLDGDTAFGKDYLASIAGQFAHNPHLSAIAVPYYHPLSGNATTDRSLLRYEIYMRHYLINMLLIGNPYAFTALGSAMTFTVGAYKRCGGITPLQGGEDFYLLQKLCKTGELSVYSTATVFPQGRESKRVPFGTGPAVAKSVVEQDASYPFYATASFEKVRQTYELFPALYEKNLSTPMTDFLCSQLKTGDVWQPLRKNFKTVQLFVKACTERVDGLRILQFLKSEHRQGSSNGNFVEFCSVNGIPLPEGFSFENTDIRQLDNIRNALFEKEMELRKGKG